MDKTLISFDSATVPLSIRPLLEHAAIYDSSCSENARTLFVDGTDKAFLKIAPKGSLEREYRMSLFLCGHGVAPKAIVYESDSDGDYLLTEAVAGEDGTAEMHQEQPERLAAVFGEYLRMLHALPVDGCPYPNRTAEMLEELRVQGTSFVPPPGNRYVPQDRVVIHGDYCLPNIVMDRFAFKGFIDVGQGGIGDRHYDLYWGIWTLGFNLQTDRYRDLFLDAYGRQDVDPEGLAYFTRLNSL
ncbi:aminoglycoside 3'-phosphotransferase [Paenibacillus hodogayensis]|uniref:Aminoglycoside 3'-phosphotransferase n=1 Tax=Paenibacillus hodogayensis TaxID=279208 RepID=A0ABV5W485_9BACL